MSSPPVHFGLTRRPTRWPRGLLVALLFGLIVGSCPAAAQTPQACLGCIEHAELRPRHRSIWILLAAQVMAAAGHYALEEHARRLGLCERNPLLRQPQSLNGCHPFAPARAAFLAVPLEFALVDSPAWGLEHRGHPRWAQGLLLLPTLWHGWAVRQTTEAIHQYQRQQALLH